MRLDPWPLLAPFIFCVLPAVAFIAALAVVFETIPWLAGTVGNVVCCALWLGILIATVAGMPMDARRIAGPADNLWGVQVIVSGMMQDAGAALPNHAGRIAIGGTMLPVPLETFMLASLCRGKPQQAGETIPPQPGEPERGEVTVSVTAVRLSRLTAHFHPRLAVLLAAETRLMLKGTRWCWFIVALGLINTVLLVPSDVTRCILLVSWLWPLALWSSLSCREARHDARQLVFSAPRLLPRQPLALWLARILGTLVTGSGVAAHLVLTGKCTRLLAWDTGALLIPTLALGAWSGSNTLFEVVFMVW